MKRVMIVDDSLFQRKFLRKLVESLNGIVVAEATNGVEAVEIYPLFSPDIVIMDIIMPEMEGTEAIESILKIDPSACIIVISSLGHDDLVSRALSLGVRQYLTKPLDFNSAANVLMPFITGS